MQSVSYPGNITAFMTSAKVSACPVPAVRGLNRQQAAAYIGVSASTFDKMVADGRMPKARRINARTIWDRVALDAAFEGLPGEEPEDDSDSWDTEA